MPCFGCLFLTTCFLGLLLKKKKFLELFSDFLTLLRYSTFRNAFKLIKKSHYQYSERERERSEINLYQQYRSNISGYSPI